MYILKLEKLEKGDIILERSSSQESIRIRSNSGSEYSHAILYVGCSSCIESDGLGVQSQNIQRLLFEKEIDALVLRLKDNTQITMIDKVIEFARQKIGTEYSAKEAIRSMNVTNIKSIEENRQFCTRFVAQAYLYAGIKIVDNPDYCSPNYIQLSEQLMVIDNVLRIALQEEIDYAKNSNNILEEQKSIHNYIFEKARNISQEDIQTFEQLNSFVIQNKKQECKITKVIEESGYLEMWKEDMKNNPWHYEYKSFLEHYTSPEQRLYVGNWLFTNEKENRKRYEQTFNTLNLGYSLYGLRYFYILIQLYENLICVSYKREKVGLLALGIF